MWEAIQAENAALIMRDARLQQTLDQMDSTPFSERDDVETLINMGMNVFFDICPRHNCLRMVAAYVLADATPSVNWAFCLEADTGRLVSAALVKG